MGTAIDEQPAASLEVTNTCLTCGKEYKKAENLARHFALKHATKRESVKLVSLPMDTWDYNKELDIFEGPSFNLDGFTVAGIMKPNYRKRGEKSPQILCVDVVLTRK